MRLIQNSARTDNSHGGQSSADLRQQGRASLACVETEWLLVRRRPVVARPGRHPWSRCRGREERARSAQRVLGDDEGPILRVRRPRGGALGVGIRQGAAGRGDDVPHRRRGIQEGRGRRGVKSDLLR